MPSLIPDVASLAVTNFALFILAASVLEFKKPFTDDFAMSLERMRFIGLAVVSAMSVGSNPCSANTAVAWVPP